jgi:hypothetical protein
MLHVGFSYEVSKRLYKQVNFKVQNRIKKNKMLFLFYFVRLKWSIKLPK